MKKVVVKDVSDCPFYTWYDKPWCLLNTNDVEVGGKDDLCKQAMGETCPIIEGYSITFELGKEYSYTVTRSSDVLGAKK